MESQACKRFVVQTLTVEHIASNALANSHAQVDEQADPSYSHACIALVGGGEVRVVVIVIVMTSVIAS